VGTEHRRAPACCRQKLRARPFASTTRSPLVARRTHSSALLGSRRRCATVARHPTAVPSGFRRWQRRALRPPLCCSIPHRGWGFGLSAEGEGFESSSDPEARNGFETDENMPFCRALRLVRLAVRQCGDARRSARLVAPELLRLPRASESRSMSLSGRRGATSPDAMGGSLGGVLDGAAQESNR
jgi:hypothetical protein